MSGHTSDAQEGRTPQRALPGHIAAALQRQRASIAAGENTADTAGTPWAGRSFEHSSPEDPQDEGAADPRLTAALAAWGAGEASEADVVDALESARVFVAGTSTHAEDPDADPAEAPEDPFEAHHHGDKAADMSLISLTAPDGRRTLPVFTEASAVSAWGADARPIPVQARKVALACVQDSTPLWVIDPGRTGHNFVLRRPGIWAVAKAEPWVPAYHDPEVSRSMHALAERLPEVAAIVPAAGPNAHGRSRATGEPLMGGGSGEEIQAHVFVRSGLDQQALNAVLQQVSSALSADALIAERVDSLSLRVMDASLLEAPDHQ